MKILAASNPMRLLEVVTLINDVVDFEASSLEARFIVKRGVDEEVHLILQSDA
jgi:DNA mismatch repair protein MSH5